MPLRRSPFATLIVPDEDQVLAALREAVSVGRNDPLLRDEDTERIDSPVRHMGLATTRMVDVALAAQLVQTHFPSDATTPDEVRSLGIAWSLHAALAGTIRLAWRALELHGNHTGYDVSAWESEAAYGAQAVVVVAVDPEPTNLPPTPIQETRDASRALAEAIAAAERDRMAVPGHLADALGHLLALWLYVTWLLRR